MQHILKGGFGSSGSWRQLINWETNAIVQARHKQSGGGRRGCCWGMGWTKHGPQGWWEQRHGSREALRFGGGMTAHPGRPFASPSSYTLGLYLIAFSAQTKKWGQEQSFPPKLLVKNKQLIHTEDFGQDLGHNERSASVSIAHHHLLSSPPSLPAAWPSPSLISPPPTLSPCVLPDPREPSLRSGGPSSRDQCTASHLLQLHFSGISKTPKDLSWRKPLPHWKSKLLPRPRGLPPVPSAARARLLLPRAEASSATCQLWGKPACSSFPSLNAHRCRSAFFCCVPSKRRGKIRYL